MTSAPSDRTLISNVSRETFERASAILKQNETLLKLLTDKWLWWNTSVNLFSRNTDATLLEKHIFHSILLLFITDIPDCSRVIDAGTGGGLPGLPMAVASREKEFILVDKVQRKCLAVRDIVRTLKLTNVGVVHSDISGIRDEFPARIVSKHAFPVKRLLGCLKHRDWMEIAMLKGSDVLSEIDEDMSRHYLFSFHTFDHIEDPFFDNRGVLLIHKKEPKSIMHEQQ